MNPTFREAREQNKSNETLNKYKTIIRDTAKNTTCEACSVKGEQNKKPQEDSPTKDQAIIYSDEDKKHLDQTMQGMDSSKQDEPRNNLSQKSDTHNSFQIPGPLPVDAIKNDVPVKVKGKSMASKIKQVIDNKKRKSVSRNIYYDSQDRDRKNMTVKNSDESPVVAITSTNLIDRVKSDVRTIHENTSILSDMDKTDAKHKDVDGKLKFSSEINIPNENILNKVDAEGATDIHTCNTAVGTDQIQDRDPELGIQTDANVDHEERLVGPSKVHASFAATPNAAPTHKSRATSPDNTDAEMSSLTDLPSEKESNSKSKSARTPLSPGEQKTTTTYTDSYTQPAIDYGSLSEGELPEPCNG
ncbi:unnamed protein product [Diatraea saccharalis]|uniref:Uncharacterized protein n=1 Tax=Diatraea saccharalis TaxID=40085 RepID=A0A9N9RFH7_9NEOP|nr:unnamed protein product [Diatraea saccharalis]